MVTQLKKNLLQKQHLMEMETYLFVWPIYSIFYSVPSKALELKPLINSPAKAFVSAAKPTIAAVPKSALYHMSCGKSRPSSRSKAFYGVGLHKCRIFCTRRYCSIEPRTSDITIPTAPAKARSLRTIESRYFEKSALYRSQTAPNYVKYNTEKNMFPSATGSKSFFKYSDNNTGLRRKTELFEKKLTSSAQSANDREQIFRSSSFEKPNFLRKSSLRSAQSANDREQIFRSSELFLKRRKTFLTGAVGVYISQVRFFSELRSPQSANDREQNFLEEGPPAKKIFKTSRTTLKTLEALPKNTNLFCLISINRTKNNTHAIISNLFGENKTKWSISAGQFKLPGGRRKTRLSQRMVYKSCLEKALSFGYKFSVIHCRGTRGSKARIFRFFGDSLSVLLIKDTTGVAHNGCRPPKVRRV